MEKKKLDIQCDFLHYGQDIRGIISKACLHLRKRSCLWGIKSFRVLQGRTVKAFWTGKSSAWHKYMTKKSLKLKHSAHFKQHSAIKWGYV